MPLLIGIISTLANFVAKNISHARFLPKTIYTRAMLLSSKSCVSFFENDTGEKTQSKVVLCVIVVICVILVLFLLLVVIRSMCAISPMCSSLFYMF